MFIVSTAETTKLSDFADLETISKHQHKSSETTDFQFYTNSQLFVEVNKQNGVEIMRIKKVNEGVTEIQRVRKLKIENAYCVACARQSIEEIALGLSNGQVRLYNYRNSDMLHRYVGDKLNSVVFLDYNASDEYIAAVHENGFINVYGTKTRAKLESINIDSNSTLARFHPTKRFHLAVASYKGSVTTYDVGTKRKIFHSIESHSAPCRDLCMSAAKPDTLLSVGYDCVINIFDTRRRSQSLKLQHNHPLSTIASSDCGTFFCVGSLKGELSTYDMRNTKSHLSIKKVHQAPVNRVAFVPEINQTGDTSNFSSAVNATLSGPSEETSKQQAVEHLESGGNTIDTPKPLSSIFAKRDSFCDFLDFQSKGKTGKTSGPLSTLSKRDSFDFEPLKRKSSIDRGSLLHTSNISPLYARQSYSLGDSFEIKPVIPDQDSNIKSEVITNPNGPLRERNNIPIPILTPPLKLMAIDENSTQDHTPYSSLNDKENIRIRLELHKPVNSTPIEKTPDTKPTVQNIPNLKEVLKQIDDLRLDMNARFEKLESEMKFDAEQNKWQIFSQASNLWSQQINNTEEIRSALTVLLQTDPFTVEFKRIKEENQQLKAELERLTLNK